MADARHIIYLFSTVQIVDTSISTAQTKVVDGRHKWPVAPAICTVVAIVATQRFECSYSVYTLQIVMATDYLWCGCYRTPVAATQARVVDTNRQ